jgi:branched-chain amino acid aminotransferase|tara:strand:- start:505 stop:1314 length:810 start_codon:yes stop_codon:yes gene_type:complete
MTKAIAWLDGQWGAPHELSLPLNDRGLQLADGLFETVLLQGGEPQLLEQHLERWATSANLLGMAPPPERSHLQPLIEEATQRCGLQRSSAVLRLNWSRGASERRGIDVPQAAQHRFWMTLEAGEPTFSAVTAIICQQERRNADSLISRCKTFAYGQAVLARREANQRGCEDALLLNTRGQLCSGTVANLMVRRNGNWLTPPLSSGCLPGVMRGRALTLGLVQEAELESDLRPDDEAALINSLSCRPLIALNGLPRSLTDTERFWRNLLE